MKRTMKKLSALIMAFAMIMSLLVVANATDDPGDPVKTVAIGTGIASDFTADNVVFNWTTEDNDVKTAFLEALTTSGKTVTITVSGDFTNSSTAATTITGYSVANPTTVSGKWNVAITKTEGSVAIGKLVITLPEGETTGGTITVTLKQSGGGGDEVTTEADADNTDSGISGAGTYEGYVDQEVFRVALPTVTAADLAFTIDPQGLIAATSAAKYTDKTYNAGSVLFLNTNNKSNDKDYSNKSDKFTLVNKGATDVDVELTVTATGTALGETPTLSFVDDTDDFTDSTDKSLYIALNTQATGEDDATVTAIALDDDTYAATATATIAKTADVYEYKYDATDGYTYGLKADASGFKQLEFWLEGAANTNATGDWGLTSGSIALALTWKVTKVSAESAASGPAVTATTVTALSRNLEITLNATNVTGYELKSVTYGDDDTDVGATMGDIDDDGAATITFTCDRTMASAAPTAVKVIFTKTEDETDTSPISVTIVSAE